MTYTCEFCKKSFARESSIGVHMCEPKRRHTQRDEPGVRFGLQAFLRFYEVHQGSSKLKTYEDFCNSSYYRAFVKFGNYCVSTHVIAPHRFLDWLLKHNKKIDLWCSDQLYTEYLKEHLLVEAAQDALERAIQQSIKWEEKTGHPAKDMLRYGNQNAICYDITSGRISPWVIYNSNSGQEFLSSASTEQVQIIWPYIDSDKWHKRFTDHRADQEWVKDILQKAGW